MNPGYSFTNMPIGIENQVHDQEACNILSNSRSGRVLIANSLIIWRLSKSVTMCVPPKKKTIKHVSSNKQKQCIPPKI